MQALPEVVVANGEDPTVWGSRLWWMRPKHTLLTLSQALCLMQALYACARPYDLQQS